LDCFDPFTMIERNGRGEKVVAELDRWTDRDVISRLDICCEFVEG